MSVVEKVAHTALEHINGQILQIGGLSFVFFGLEVDLEQVFVVIGVIFSFIGLLITHRSAKVQKKVNLLEIEVNRQELENLKLEREILINEQKKAKDGKQR